MYFFYLISLFHKKRCYQWTQFFSFFLIVVVLYWGGVVLVSRDGCVNNVVASVSQDSSLRSISDFLQVYLQVYLTPV